MGDAFTKKGLDSPRLMAEMLMAHVIGCERLRLYMDPDRPATPLERSSLRDLAARALKHEPVQYLVGEAWFFGLPFHVDRNVLVPRPATETLVQELLQHHRAKHGAAGVSGDATLIADVCTGSGCIGIAVLKNLPGARVVASDVSGAAIEVARRNATRHGVADRMDLLEGDMLTPILSHPVARGAGSLDYLLSNPPYIPDDEWPDKVDLNVREHEPHLALRGGPDGLTFVRALLDAGPKLLKPGGMMLIEVADSRADQAAELASASPLLGGVKVLRDFEGLSRVIAADRVA